MGCDIHTVIERKVTSPRINARWVAVAIEHDASRSRNYDRFAALAGVRGDGPEPRGLPDDASDTALTLADDWGADGHSHSWLPLDEAAALYLATEFNPSEFVQKYPASEFFGVERPDDTDEYRLVFWFDN